MRGKFDEAIREYQRARELSGGGSFGLLNLGHAYAESGRIKDAQNVLDLLMRLSEQGHSVSYDIAFVHLGLRDREKTFAWLGKAFLERGNGLTSLGHEPLWDELRSDPRFIALLKKMGLGATPPKSTSRGSGK